MRGMMLMVAALLVAAREGRAQQRPDSTDARASAWADAKAIIRDLDRIVTPDGIQETYTLRAGGIDHWVYARGQHRDNPVLLFVHGGPASPMAPAMWQWQRPLEEYFTVVQYDQRGAGRTYLEADPDSVAGTITIPRYVDDAIAIAEQVRRRYGARKLVLVGHSWGTTVGMHAVLRRPDLFSAYVGIGQVIDSRENERLSYDYGLRRATEEGNADALRELRSIAPYPGDRPITRERIIIARKWAQHYGGLSAFRDQSKYYFEAPLLSPEYDSAAVAAIDRGNLLTLGRILPELLAVDFTAVRRFPIPVVMFMGRHDYSTPSAPTDAWLRRVQAPSKRGVWFESSSHMLPFEEPGKMLVSLLEFVRPLATTRDTVFRAPPLRNEPVVYRTQAPPGADSTRGPVPMGRTIVTEAARTHDGEPAILQILTVPGRGLVDSLLVRRRDLAPIWEREHVRGLSIAVEFAGRRVRWTRQRAGEPAQSGDTTYAMPVYAFNQLEMLVRALATEPGRTVVVPMVSEGTAELELDTLTVEGTPGSGHWRVRFADSALVSHYELRGAAREVAGLELVMREGGARYTRVAERAPSRPREPAAGARRTGRIHGRDVNAPTAS